METSSTEGGGGGGEPSGKARVILYDKLGLHSMILPTLLTKLSGRKECMIHTHLSVFLPFHSHFVIEYHHYCGSHVRYESL